MPKGVYEHKTRRGEKSEVIINFLGRRPKDMPEYKRVWRYLFSGLGNNKDQMKIQRQRHLSHGYGLANRNRIPCIFCSKEGRR